MLTDDELSQRLRPPSTSFNLKQDKTNVTDTNQFNYLFECYKRLNKVKSEKKIFLTNDLYMFCSNLIINICRTLLNIFETSSNPDLDFNIPSDAITTITDHGYSSNLNRKALSDPAIQLVVLLRKYLIKENLDMDNENVQIFKSFYEAFIGLFEESSDLVVFFTNTDSTSGDLSKLMESCELNFLNNVFIFLNKYFVKLTNCEFYSNEYIKELELVEFITKKSKLMKYLFVLNSFPQVRSTGFNWQSETLIGNFFVLI